ncbi:MAG: protein kinase [Pseudomonadota bacterium]
MITQQCPNCFKRVDVSIYVSGQRVRCPRCRVPFVVVRQSMGPVEAAPAAATHEPPRRSPVEARTTPSRPMAALRPDGQPVSLLDPVDEAWPTRGRPAPEQPPLDAPEIPGYRITALIGQGAMGTVYRAQRVRDGVTVALKVLAEQLQTSAEFVARFEREIAALAAVQHPNVVRLIEMSQVGERRFFAMEFAEGTSLRAEFAVTKPVPSRVVSILIAVTEGLAAAHDAGVIHRDLKPENVVVMPDGGVRIVDFGLAGLFGDGDPHPNLTRSRVTMGTVNYMAPEQRTDAKYVDQRADIYAVGVMLYEGLTGELPVGRFQFPNERGLKLPLLCDSILSKALARDPRQRYPDARAVLDDLHKLERLLRSAALADTVLPRPPPDVVHSHVVQRRQSLRQTVLHPASRRWALVSLASMMVAGAGFGLGWRWLERQGIYEVVIEDGQARREETRNQLEGPSLGLVAADKVPLSTTLGLWRVAGAQLEHQVDAPVVRLQPTVASATLGAALTTPRLRVQAELRRPAIPALARQAARSQGFVDEARLDLSVRIGVGLDLGDRVLGGYVDSDGTCGYLERRGLDLTVSSHVCGGGGAQSAVLELWVEGQALHLRVDDLRLPPHPLDSEPGPARPALLCQNANCIFSAASAQTPAARTGGR